MDWSAVIKNPFLKNLPFKIELYLAKGAIEVWIVSEDDSTKYYSYEGELEESRQLAVP